VTHRLDLIASGATFSDDRVYRYSLWRLWQLGPRACFIMLNPSTADEDINDPTVERCERRARAWGYAGLEVLNLFAYRATDPSNLYLQGGAAVGPENDAWITRGTAASARIVCAWGGHGRLLGRSEKVRALLASRPLYALRVNAASGEPGHPLYVPYSAMPKPLGDGTPPWQSPTTAQRVIDAPAQEG